jgi:hypothetical protein
LYNLEVSETCFDTRLSDRPVEPSSRQASEKIFVKSSEGRPQKGDETQAALDLPLSIVFCWQDDCWFRLGLDSFQKICY